MYIHNDVRPYLIVEKKRSTFPRLAGHRGSANVHSGGGFDVKRAHHVRSARRKPRLRVAIIADLESLGRTSKICIYGEYIMRNTDY